MNTNGMPPMGGMDPGDETDGLAKCEQDIEDLETRVAALEQKAGISSLADEAEPAGGKTFPVKKPSSMAGTKPFFGGSY